VNVLIDTVLVKKRKRKKRKLKITLL
jgi:hypothetical protein